MTTLQAIILGIIQGLTEFLPVSSSGHLVLTQILFGFQDLDQLILFDLVCHGGTLLALFVAFFDPIKLILQYDRKKIAQLLLAISPLFPMLLIIKPIESTFNSPALLGFSFLITALLLYLGIRMGPQIASADRSTAHPWRDSFIIGLFQVVAIIPGISRSGSTISGARILGWDYPQAIQFSFLLAIPTMLGAIVVAFLRFWMETEPMSVHIPLMEYFWGFLFSFLAGFLSLKILIKMGSKRSGFMIFVWYCLFIGLFTLFYTHYMM